MSTISYRAMDRPSLDALIQRNLAPVRAVKVPFSAWAAACGGAGGYEGLAHGWHVLAAGKSGQGKTYLALNLAAHAIENAEGVVFHSLEMGWDEIAVRMLAIASGERSWKLSPGKWASAESMALASAALLRKRGQMITNDEPMFKLVDLLKGIHRTFEQYGAKLHIIDYLQLAWTGEAETQALRIAEVSNALRQIAKELRIVTFCLSQFGRETSKVATRPQKEGMIGTSALENDADQVLLLDHSRVFPTSDNLGKRTGVDTWLILDKNRHGPQSDIPIKFRWDTGQIRQRDDDEIGEREVTK